MNLIHTNHLDQCLGCSKPLLGVSYTERKKNEKIDYHVMESNFFCHLLYFCKNKAKQNHTQNSQLVKESCLILGL